MKNTLLLSLLFSTFFSAQSQNAKLYHEKDGANFVLYVDNHELCPVSFEIHLELKNMISSEGEKRIFVIAPGVKKQQVLRLKPKAKGKYNFKYKSWKNYGDHYLKNYDKDFEYNLPFARTQSFQLYQGYNGKSTHQGKNALDFTMPVGTPIHSVRSGRVVSVVESNKLGCPDQSCAKFGNTIIIYHSDGTFSKYVHLKFNGSVVNLGDFVKKGELIGYSGNTGWTTGPHLHLEIFLGRIRSPETLQTKFRIGSGKKSIFLKE